MANFIFWVVYLITIVCSTYFVLMSDVKLNKFSVGSMIYYSLFLFSFVGYPIIYYKLVPYYLNIGINDNDIMLKMFIISSLVILQFFYGFYIYSNNKWKVFSHYKEKNSIIKKKHSIKDSNISVPLWIIFFLACLSFLIYYLLNIPSIALIEAINGSSRYAIAEARSNMTNGFIGYHWIRIILKGVLPFLSTISLLEFLKTRSKLWISLFIISLLTIAFIMLMDAQKAPIVWYILTLVAVVFVFYDKEINIKSGLLITVLMLALLYISYIFFMDSRVELMTLISPIRRALTGQIVPFYSYMNLVPEVIPFQLGKTFPNPNGIFPFEHFNYTVEIAKIVNGSNNNVISTLPTAFWGELWINFGWVGIFFFPIIFGMIVSLVHNLFSVKKLSTLNMALMIWISFDLKSLAFSGFSSYFFPITLILILIIWGILSYFKVDNIFLSNKGVLHEENSYDSSK